MTGRDARGEKFELLYGKLYITTAQDIDLRRRAAAFMCNEQCTWKPWFIDILWKEPTKQELDNSSDIVELKQLMDELEVLEEWEQDGATFKLCIYPINETQKLLKADVKILCLKNAMRLPGMTYNKPNYSSKMLFNEMSNTYPEFKTSEDLRTSLGAYEKTEKVIGPLLHLMDAHNPILIVSDSMDRGNASPKFFDPDSDRPFLKLQDGNKLYFKMNGEDSPSCYIELLHGKAFFPLHLHGVPGSFITQTGVGICMVNILKYAGFEPTEAESAITNWLKSNCKTIPPKFMTFLEGKNLANLVNSERVKQGTNTDWGYSTVEEQVRTEFDIFGYRHLIDTRGTYIFPHLLYSSSDPQHIFAFTEKNRGIVSNDQVYSWNDLEDIKNNISVEHLQKTILFEPSFGSYESLIKNNSELLVHPDLRRPSYLAEPVAVQEVKKAWVKREDEREAWDQKENAWNLTKPIPLWRLNKDTHQQVTLTNLHNAYIKLLENHVKIIGTRQDKKEKSEEIKTDEKRKRNRLESLQERKSREERELANKKATKEVEKEDEKKDTEARERVLGVHQASARRFAEQKYFHRSIVYYNDLLQQLEVNEDQEFGELVTKIPSTDRAEQFMQNVEEQLASVKLLMCVQTELALVLHAAGLKESSHAVFSRAVDDYDSLLKPLFAMSKKLMESYGVSFSKKFEQSLKDVDGMINISRNSIKKFSLSVGWRNPGFHEEDKIAESLVRTRSFANLLDKQTSAGNIVDGLKLTEVESIELESLRLSDSQEPVTEFRFWLERKKILIQHPDIGLRINRDSDFDVRIASPYTYNKEFGFTKSIDLSIRDTDVNEFSKWCSLSLDEANKSPHAVTNSFLLAWHWLDRNDNSKARAALINLGLASSKQVQDDKVDEAMFVNKINSYTALACANCISLKLPGIVGLKVDLTHTLRPQLTIWKREFSASGYSPSHAHSAESNVLAIIEESKKMMRRSISSKLDKPYFFPDYKCQFGGVPDYVVRDVLEKPDLFQQIDGADVNGNGKPEAVKGGNQWILVNKEAADKYYSGFKLDPEISKNIVNIVDIQKK